MELQELKQQLTELTEKHDFQGVLRIDNNGEQLTFCRGHLEPEQVNAVTPQTRYPLGIATRLFTLITALKLVEEGKLELKARITDFFPTLTAISDATVKNLVRLTSGIEDYSTTVLGMQIYNRKKEFNLSEGEFFAYRTNQRSRAVTVQEVIEMVQELPPQGKCGRVSFSTTEYLLLGDIVERVSGKTLNQLFNQYIIEPLNLSNTTYDGNVTHQGYLRFENSEEVYAAGNDGNVNGNCGIVTTIGDTMKLLDALLHRRLLTAKSWEFILTKYDSFARCAFEKIQSWYSIGGNNCGSTCMLYFSFATNTTLALFSNRGTKYVKDFQGERCYFYDEVINRVQAVYLKPTKLTLSPLCRANGFDAQGIKIREDQKEFVGTPKDTLSLYAINERNDKCYVLTDCDVIVGLSEVEANKKTGEFWINMYMIDKMYQGKGYGKMGIALLRDKLVSLGAKKVQIAFNQRNERARHVYESCGFRCVEAWDWAIRMVYLPPQQ